MFERGSNRRSFVPTGIRRRRRGRGERGAVLVETAILLPVILLITFGLIEFSSAYQDSSVTASAARAAARISSAQARQPLYAVHAAEAAASVLTTVPRDAPIEMWVYKANATGHPGTGTDFASCSTACIKYQWDDHLGAFDTDDPLGGGWAHTAHNVCSEPYDQLGVYVKIDHTFLTKLFGTSMELSDHAVFRFEPTPSAECAAS